MTVESAPQSARRRCRAATVDVATTLESLVPADVLAEADPALWGRTVVQVAQGLATHPADVGRVVAAHAALAARIGTAAVARAIGSTAEGPLPVEKDGRFKDTTWEENPVYWGLRQQYLAAGGDAARPRRRRRRSTSRRASGPACSSTCWAACSRPPTCCPATRPRSSGRSRPAGRACWPGCRQMLDDLATNQGRPQQVDRTNLRVGQELAATPGKVVYRNRLMELIQFEPQTDEVHEIPILVSPPWINKYYVMDLAPGRSFLEWAVQHGHTVFVISYRDPDESMADDGPRRLPRARRPGRAGRRPGDHRAPTRSTSSGCAWAGSWPPSPARCSTPGARAPRQLADAAEHPARLLRPRARERASSTPRSSTGSSARWRRPATCRPTRWPAPSTCCAPTT